MMLLLQYRYRYMCLFLWIWLSIITRINAAPPSSSHCSSVGIILEPKGISSSELLDKPSPGGMCTQDENCCSPHVRTKLATIARKDIETTARNQANRVASILSEKSKKFDDFFKTLLNQSRHDLHQMFVRTYGLIYERHAHLFVALFSDLEKYHAKGGLDLAVAMDSFFAILYQRMFAVLNSQYHFDENYLSCVSEHMRELQPFGDVPGKLAAQVKRAFVATRTFTKALSAAADVARVMANIRVSQSCQIAAGRVRWCGACSGISQGLCPRLCLNLALGCLPQHADLAPDWDAFVDAMDKVSDRLLGPFNIAMVVEPIDIKISEAIMNFQERSQELSQKVFSGCGKPVLGQRPDSAFMSHSRQKRSYLRNEFLLGQDDDDFVIETSYESLVNKNPNVANLINAKNKLFQTNLHSKRSKREADPDPDPRKSSEIVFEKYNFDQDHRNTQNGGKRNRKKQGNNNKNRKVTANSGSSSSNSGRVNNPVVVKKDDDEDDAARQLERLVTKIRQHVRETRHVWSRLPHIYCTGDHVAEGPANEDNCWNGTHVAKYLPSLAGEGTAALATNPELRSSSTLDPMSGSSNPPTAAIVTAQQFALRSIANKLKNAFNGMDVEWDGEDGAKDNEDGSSFTNGSGSGSGDDSDDEDENKGPPDQENDPDEDGSGHGSIPKVPKFEHKDPDEDISEDISPFRPPDVIRPSKPDIIHAPDDSDENDVELDHNSIETDINKESSSGTTSNAQSKQEMSLQRALVTYLFPIVCVWFGGIISEIA